MRQPFSALRRLRHGFGSRSAFTSLKPATASRIFRHWLQRATDRAIGAGFSDQVFNPYLFVVESGR